VCPPAPPARCHPEHRSRCRVSSRARAAVNVDLDSAESQRGDGGGDGMGGGGAGKKKTMGETKRILKIPSEGLCVRACARARACVGFY
jgi:hypothetical protein